MSEMELGLSLGDASTKPFNLPEKPTGKPSRGLGLGFCTGLGFVGEEEEMDGRVEGEERGSADPPVQLDLLPLYPAAETSNLEGFTGGFDLSRSEGEAERATSSRGSDEEENVLARKKLRLSKNQSDFLEQSFKEQNTLNPKHKLALAKQINLRPRQIEVWFQNRRARTKLKQTEVETEYLKRCCERLTEENRRLQSELQGLRALKTTSHPFYTHLPATTLTMCPSCERVSTTTSATPAEHRTAKPTFSSLLSKPRVHHFATS